MISLAAIAGGLAAALLVGAAMGWLALMREYILSGFFSAVTAFIIGGQLNSVKANYAESYLLVAVLACFLGRVDPFGGGGKLSGMVLSVVVLSSCPPV